MATIGSFTKSGNPKNMRVVTSAAAAKTDTVELAGLPDGYQKYYLGVQMFDAQGDLMLDSAGTFAVTYKTKSTMQYETPAYGTPIDATAPGTVPITGNVYGVKVVPSSLSTTVTWVVVLTCNKG